MGGRGVTGRMVSRSPPRARPTLCDRGFGHSGHAVVGADADRHVRSGRGHFGADAGRIGTVHGGAPRAGEPCRGGRRRRAGRGHQGDHDRAGGIVEPGRIVAGLAQARSAGSQTGLGGGLRGSDLRRGELLVLPQSRRGRQSAPALSLPWVPEPQRLGSQLPRGGHRVVLPVALACLLRTRPDGRVRRLVAGAHRPRRGGGVAGRRYGRRLDGALRRAGGVRHDRRLPHHTGQRVRAARQARAVRSEPAVFRTRAGRVPGGRGPVQKFGRSAVVSYRWRWLSWASWRRPDIASWR